MIFFDSRKTFFLQLEKGGNPIREGDAKQFASKQNCEILLLDLILISAIFLPVSAPVTGHKPLTLRG